MHLDDRKTSRFWRKPAGTHEEPLFDAHGRGLHIAEGAKFRFVWSPIWGMSVKILPGATSMRVPIGLIERNSALPATRAPSPSRKDLGGSELASTVQLPQNGKMVEKLRGNDRNYIRVEGEAGPT
jgi:hypothetical protein